jgi:hypothetical protein
VSGGCVYSGVKVAFTYYPLGKPEQVLWTQMPMLPAVGHTVHLNFNKPFRQEDTRAFEVVHIAWAQDQDYPRWHAEIGVR